MKIATATTMRTRFFRNTEISIDELAQKLSTPTITDETFEEFKKMSKAEQSAIKDKGCFVGGHLNQGKRHRGSVLCRSVVCLDMDYGVPGVIENVVVKLPWYCLWHTTHKHCPDSPRIRLVIPLKREVTEAEYPAVARMIASEIGMDLFDDTTYEPHRLMHYPTASKDGGEFRSGTVEGDWIDPDAYLAKYSDWRDARNWPRSSRQVEVSRPKADKAEDPLAKDGVIGAFCRAYRIQDAILKFIPTVYTETDSEDRWTFAEGQSAAGLVVYDGKFAYSHHASDPCCEMLVNAFDLVRIHLFGDQDASCDGDTPMSRRPSYKKMCELAWEDDAVHMAMVSKGSTESWMSELGIDKKTGTIATDLRNLKIIMEHDSAFLNIAFDEFSGLVRVTGPVPWKRPLGNDFWTDADTCRLKERLDMNYAVFSERNFDICFSNVVHDRGFHPVRDYLDGLPEWDGNDRIENLFVQYFGAEDSEYVRQVSRKTWVQIRRSACSRWCPRHWQEQHRARPCHPGLLF